MHFADLAGLAAPTVPFALAGPAGLVALAGPAGLVAPAVPTGLPVLVAPTGLVAPAAGCLYPNPGYLNPLARSRFPALQEYPIADPHRQVLCLFLSQCPARGFLEQD
jgi:hypothetical protein